MLHKKKKKNLSQGIKYDKFLFTHLFLRIYPPFIEGNVVITINK